MLNGIHVRCPNCGMLTTLKHLIFGHRCKYGRY